MVVQENHEGWDNKEAVKGGIKEEQSQSFRWDKGRIKSIIKVGESGAVKAGTKK